MKDTSVNQPNLDRRYFWEFNYDRIDWQECYKMAIARIIERGGQEEWNEIIRFYGYDKVVTAIKDEIVFLADYAIERASIYFSIAKEDMFCFRRKQSRLNHWI